MPAIGRRLGFGHLQSLTVVSSMSHLKVSVDAEVPRTQIDSLKHACVAGV